MKLHLNIDGRDVFLFDEKLYFDGEALFYHDLFKTSDPFDSFYLVNGKCHRDNDQPAGIYADGTQEWYVNGQLHRDNDQPAIIFADGSQYWYVNGQRHRDNDQPAVVLADGTQHWYVNGIFVKSE